MAEMKIAKFSGYGINSHGVELRVEKSGGKYNLYVGEDSVAIPLDVKVNSETGYCIGVGMVGANRLSGKGGKQITVDFVNNPESKMHEAVGQLEEFYELESNGAVVTKRRMLDENGQEKFTYGYLDLQNGEKLPEDQRTQIQEEADYQKLVESKKQVDKVVDDTEKQQTEEAQKFYQTKMVDEYGLMTTDQYDLAGRFGTEGFTNMNYSFLSGKMSNEIMTNFAGVPERNPNPTTLYFNPEYYTSDKTSHGTETEFGVFSDGYGEDKKMYAIHGKEGKSAYQIDSFLQLPGGYAICTRKNEDGDVMTILYNKGGQCKIISPEVAKEVYDFNVNQKQAMAQAKAPALESQQKAIGKHAPQRASTQASR